METSKGHWMKEGKKNKGIEGGEGLKGEIFLCQYFEMGRLLLLCLSIGSLLLVCLSI